MHWMSVLGLHIGTGVDAGSRLRVRGEGNVGRRGGEPGDLYVFISVKPHPAGLRREGTTIHSDVDISFVDAILGTTVKVQPPSSVLCPSQRPTVLTDQSLNINA